MVCIWHVKLRFFHSFVGCFESSAWLKFPETTKPPEKSGKPLAEDSDGGVTGNAGSNFQCHVHHWRCSGQFKVGRAFSPPPKKIRPLPWWGGFFQVGGGGVGGEITGVFQPANLPMVLTHRYCQLGVSPHPPVEKPTRVNSSNATSDQAFAGHGMREREGGLGRSAQHCASLPRPLFFPWKTKRLGRPKPFQSGKLHFPRNGTSGKRFCLAEVLFFFP